MIFLTIGSYGCSVNQARNNHEFMLGDVTIGVFDSKVNNGQIGPKISMLSGEFIRQFKLPQDQQNFYCYTSQPMQLNFQPDVINSNETSLEDPQNIFEILSMLKEIKLSLFEEYLNCIGNAFQVSQDRINQGFGVNYLQYKSAIILEKRELRGSLKELKHLQKLNCGFISCYSRSVEKVEESKIFQLCSTFMDTSDDNFDLNDFLGIGVNADHNRGLICSI